MTTMPLGYWYKVLDRLSEQHFLVAIDEHGLTLRQWQLLNELRTGKTTIDELDAAITTVTAALAPDAQLEPTVDSLTELIESGWVATTAIGYELTERGLHAIEGLLGRMAESEAASLAGLSEITASELSATLQQVAHNLGYQG